MIKKSVLSNRLENSIRLLTNKDGTYGVTICSVGENREIINGDIVLSQTKFDNFESANKYRNDVVNILKKALL